MAYTVIPTITTGDVATAAWGNTHLKDNFAAGVPDIFTTDGDAAVADASNSAVRIAAFTSSTGTLKHEVGGLEFDLNAVVAGGIPVGSGSGTMSLLVIGSNQNEVLTVDSGETNGMKWAAAPGGSPAKTMTFQAGGLGIELAHAT